MGKPEEEEEEENFKLVGFKNFIRRNPRSDLFPVLSFHHIEFWTSDATTAASRFSFSLGLPLVSRSPSNSSHLLRSRSSSLSLSLLFTSPSSPPSTPHPIPSFNPSRAHSFISLHGLAVRAIALLVPDASTAFHASVSRGALPSHPPTPLGHGFSLSEISLYADVILRFISIDPHDPDHSPSIRFLPGFDDVANVSPALDYGIRSLDHAVGNVEQIAPVVSYIKSILGFHEFAEFTAEDVGTAESGLNSMVLANNEENVLLPLNEPVHGTKRRSQIQTYLDYNGGPGVQHLALRSEDVIGTVRRMKEVEGMGGFEFMPGPPGKYYEGVRRRAGDVLSEEQIRECQELGLLVDRDDQGVLIQIFTKPIGDRPTIFLEIIQRIGCMVKDDNGKEYQKGGCGGFGKGNFAELFKCIEDYEKSLEAKQQLTAVKSS